MRADLHWRFTGPAHGSWDYIESYFRDDLLIVRLHHDIDGPIDLEVELEDPVDPDQWQLLDTWIVEFMDTGRPGPSSVVDGVTTYRID